MRISKSTLALIAIGAIIMSILYMDAMSDRPKICAQKFANESVVRSIAPYVD